MRTSPQVELAPAAAERAGSCTDADIGAAIRARRTKIRKRLPATSAAAGIDERVLSRIERGERPCRVTELAAIAKALRLSPMSLLGLAVASQPSPTAAGAERPASQSQ